jgi:hypothetical protein
MVVKLTLDTNCIIALENAESSASAIRQLVQYAHEGIVELAILGISASENQRAFYHGQDFTGFQNRISSLGLGKLDILKPIAIWDVTFWDWCIMPTDKDLKLLKDLWGTIFPKSETDWQKRATLNGVDVNDASTKESKKWRNELCDAQIGWATIHYGYDALVTLNTSDFQSNTLALSKLGMPAVWEPQEAVRNV